MTTADFAVLFYPLWRWKQGRERELGGRHQNRSHCSRWRHTTDAYCDRYVFLYFCQKHSQCFAFLTANEFTVDFSTQIYDLQISCPSVKKQLNFNEKSEYFSCGLHFAFICTEFHLSFYNMVAQQPNVILKPSAFPFASSSLPPRIAPSDHQRCHLTMCALSWITQKNGNQQRHLLLTVKQQAVFVC